MPVAGTPGPRPADGGATRPGPLTWALVSAVSLLYLVRIRMFDVWWHLATARFILEHGTIPATDPFSYTARGAPWTFVNLARLVESGLKFEPISDLRYIAPELEPDGYTRRWYEALLARPDGRRELDAQRERARARSPRSPTLDAIDAITR